MSDENDAASGEPAEAPTTPAVGAEGPTEDLSGSRTADEPVTVADAPPEAPTEVAPPATVAAAGEAPPAPAAASSATTEPGARRGVFVPAWVAVVVGVLVIAGLGFAIGWIAAPNDDSNASPAVATSPSGNSNGNGSSNGNGNSNGQNVPSVPGNGNGNGSDDSSGDNSGDSTTPPLLRGAYLGVSVESAANNAGATIASVDPDSPAADGGLKAGDVVTAVDGTTVTSAVDLVRQIREHDIDDSITITYTRNGSSAEAKVTLASRPASQSVS